MDLPLALSSQRITLLKSSPSQILETLKREIISAFYFFTMRQAEFSSLNFFMKSGFKLLIIYIFQYIRILFAASSCCIFLTFLAVVHMSFHSRSGETLELRLCKLSILFSDFLRENIHTNGLQLKFEYMKLLAKTTLSLRPKNDFSRVRAFS